MNEIHLKVNGRANSLNVDPATPLLYVLSGELEKSSFAWGTPLRIDSAVLKQELQRWAMLPCLLPM